MLAGKGDGFPAVEHVVYQQDVLAFHRPRRVGVHQHTARAFACIGIALQPDCIEAEIEAVPRQRPHQVRRERRRAQHHDNAGPRSRGKPRDQPFSQPLDSGVNLFRCQQDVDICRNAAVSDGRPP